MTDYTHFHVMHKASGKVVSIYQMTHDATWAGREKEEFIALPADTPEEVEEIQMCFTRRFKRYGGTEREQSIAPFFKRKPGQVETLSEKKRGGESQAHKLAKEQIYIGLLNGDLKINGKTAKELNVVDLGLEEHSDTGHSIADVFVKFDNHPMYKNGVCIEVQFSPQNEEKTKERTLSRLREGWCVIWLWREDFKEGRLIVDNLEVKAHEEYLKDLREDEYEKFLKRMNDVGELIDAKLGESLLRYRENCSKINKIYSSEMDDFVKEKIEEWVERSLARDEHEGKIEKDIECLNSRIEELDEFINQAEVEFNNRKFELDEHHTNLVIRFKNIVNNCKKTKEITEELEKWLQSQVEKYKVEILKVHQNEEINRRIREIESKRKEEMNGKEENS